MKSNRFKYNSSFPMQINKESAKLASKTNSSDLKTNSKGIQSSSNMAAINSIINQGINS